LTPEWFAVLITCYGAAIYGIYKLKATEGKETLWFLKSLTVLLAAGGTVLSFFFTLWVVLGGW
jgi:hypothetical protein